MQSLWRLLSCFPPFLNMNVRMANHIFWHWTTTGGYEDVKLNQRAPSLFRQHILDEQRIFVTAWPISHGAIPPASYLDYV